MSRKDGFDIFAVGQNLKKRCRVLRQWKKISWNPRPFAFYIFPISNICCALTWTISVNQIDIPFHVVHLKVDKKQVEVKKRMALVAKKWAKVWELWFCDSLYCAPIVFCFLSAKGPMPPHGEISDRKIHLVVARLPRCKPVKLRMARILEFEIVAAVLKFDFTYFINNLAAVVCFEVSQNSAGGKKNNGASIWKGVRFFRAWSCVRQDLGHLWKKSFFSQMSCPS